MDKNAAQLEQQKCHNPGNSSLESGYRQGMPSTTHFPFDRADRRHTRGIQQGKDQKRGRCQRSKQAGKRLREGGDAGAGKDGQRTDHRLFGGEAGDQ